MGGQNYDNVHETCYKEVAPKTYHHPFHDVTDCLSYAVTMAVVDEFEFVITISILSWNKII